MSHKPSNDDWKDWQQSPVTKWVFEEIQLMAVDYCRAVGNGATLNDSSTEKTALMTAKSVGFIEGLHAITKLEVKE